MNLTQLKQGLEKMFSQKAQRIVFWYDAEKSFIEEFESMCPNGIKAVNMANQSALGMKLKLELEDTEGKYLLYFPSPEPEIYNDWLLDIKLYSQCFYADRLSIIFDELGLHNQNLREHLKERPQFLASKARVSSLKRFVNPDFDAQKLDLAMMAVLVKANGSNLLDILFALADDALSEDCGLEPNPPLLKALVKYDLVPALLTTLNSEVGYPVSAKELSGEDGFNLGQFFVRLLVTGYCESIGSVPVWAQDLVMTSADSRASAIFITSRWRASESHYHLFDAVSAWVSETLNIKDKINNLDIDQLSEIATFEIVEQKIIIELTSSIPKTKDKDLANLRDVISLRLDGYWASNRKNDTKRHKYCTIYKALLAAIDLFSLRQSYADGFNFQSFDDFYKTYANDIYRFDMAYRHYSEASQRAHVDIIKSLDDEVENCYVTWYVDNLAKNWGDLLESENKLNLWKVSGIPNQQNFYKLQIGPLQSMKPKRRIAVIISDAFRYEAAVELCDRINVKRYSKASLSSQLGVVPSYTTLGMASLLPHKSLEYRDTVSDDVFVDGQSSKGTLSRNKILSKVNGLAVTAETVKSWSRDEGRDALKECDLMYVYHNVVDARGDNSSTESETFLAVEQAIEELTELTRKIMLHFNTSTILITADHGFLFNCRKPDEADRTSSTQKPVDTIKSKKRYVIGQNLPDTNDAWKGSTHITAGTDSDTDFWIPKGANRFHFVGGSRFIHGGAMPQEIVVPIITVKQLRGEKAQQRTKRKVEVISPRPTIKIVNKTQTIDLMQTEAVSDQIIPISLSVSIHDGPNKVSSEESITFDSRTDAMSERVKQVTLSLSGNEFDRNKDYSLVLKDKDLNVELVRYKVTIDLMYVDDF